VIANYNGAHTLAPTIKSILNQSYPHFKLTVLDNVSTDNSFEVVNQFEDPRVEFVACEKHLPMASNWSRAAKFAQSEYVAVIHADDVWRKDFLMRMLTNLQNDLEAKAVICDAEFIDGQGHHFDIPYYNKGNRQLRRSMTADNLNDLLIQMYVRPCAWLARRKLFDIHEFSNDFYYASDWEFWLRVFSDCKVLNEPDVLCDYRIHKLSRTFSEKQIMLRLDEELTIVTSAINRSKDRFSERVQEKAYRRIDERHIKCVIDLFCAGRIKLAFRKLRQGFRIRGVRRSFIGLSALITERKGIYYLYSGVVRKFFPGPTDASVDLRNNRVYHQS